MQDPDSFSGTTYEMVLSEPSHGYSRAVPPPLKIRLYPFFCGCFCSPERWSLPPWLGGRDQRSGRCVCRCFWRCRASRRLWRVIEGWPSQPYCKLYCQGYPEPYQVHNKVVGKAEGKVDNKLHQRWFHGNGSGHPWHFSVRAAVRLIEVIFSNHASRGAHVSKRFDLAGGVDPHLALKLAHYAYVLETGEVVMAGPGAELLASPELRKAYLGEW